MPPSNSKFLKIGPAYYRQDTGGNLYAVTDTETLGGLKAGQLPYNSLENSRGLTFAGKTTSDIPASERELTFNSPAPAPVAGNTSSIVSNVHPAPVGQNASQPTGGTDISALVKQKITEALKTYRGVSTVDELEGKRQELLRKQLLSRPYADNSETVLTPAQKLSLMRQRGQEYEPMIKSLEEQIQIAAKKQESGGYNSALGKEYSDYVNDELSRGTPPNGIMSFNEYGTFDANRKKSVTNILNGA